MNQKLISNQEVFGSVQPATLKVEPYFKSTILYSNRFASNKPIEATGELLQILDSSIGSAGTNVLIQLKQKLTVLEGGPWYIDLINGVIHIHNHRYTSEPVSYYCYQSENGEVLSAAFRLVDQYKGLGSLRSFVDSLTKGLQNFVGSLQNSIQDQIRSSISSEKDALEDYYNSTKTILDKYLKDRLIEKPDKTRVDRKAVEIKAQEANKPWVRNDVKTAKMKYKFSSQKERNDLIASRKKEVRDNIDIPNAIKLARKQNVDLDIALKRYEQLRDNPSSNPTEVEASRQFVYQVAKGKKVYAGTSRGLYGEFYKDITIYDFAHSGSSGGNGSAGGSSQFANSGSPGKAAMDARVREAVNRLLSVNGTRAWEYLGYTPGVWKPVTGWMTPTKAFGHWYNGFESGMYMKYKAVVRVKFKGYYGMNVYEDMSKIIGSAIPRKQPSGPASINVGSFLNNAKNNLGRHKKETRLEGTLLVVGNPHLETCQQLYLSNVSKNYSGLWYIAKVIHKLEPPSGYTTECLLLRSMPKKKTEGTSEFSTQPIQESGTGKQETRLPKPNGTSTTNHQGKSKQTSGKQTQFLNAFEADWIVQNVRQLKNVKDVEKVATREILDIEVTKAATGNSPITTNKKGVTSKDQLKVITSKEKLSDDKFKAKVLKSAGLKDKVDRIVKAWSKSRGHKN